MATTVDQELAQIVRIRIDQIAANLRRTAEAIEEIRPDPNELLVDYLGVAELVTSEVSALMGNVRLQNLISACGAADRQSRLP